MKKSPTTPRPSPTSSTIPPTSVADPQDRLAYIALALTPGLGARRLAALLSRHGSAGRALEAARALPTGRDALERDALRRAREASVDDAERLAAAAARDGIRLLLPGEPDFPARLRSIPDPPLLLFVRGRIELLAAPAVAIVGSRDHTGYGREVAETLAAAVASVGVVVVSGMARGLDAVAHSAALDAGGTTAGVLGHGIGVVYPKVNRPLFDRVEAHGVLLSEHPPGEQPTTGAFPRRNRLISGLASVLVVVEAAKGSGTMLTVAAALEQGRDVMAVPGPITQPTSAATNQLIRDGAEPLLHPDDLLARFGAVAPAPGSGPLDPPPCTLAPEEARVFDALSLEARHVDELTLAVGMPVGTILGVLCGLELGGLVEQLPGSRFRRTARSW